MNSEAHYDVETDTIRGCRPYTYEWFHERRHQMQFRTIKLLKRFNQNLEIISYGATSGTLLAIIFGLIPIVDGLIIMGLVNAPLALLNLLLEGDAVLFGTIDWWRYTRK